ncbi:hypothetical protein BDP27DRAFT_1425842 [Rhodocollybia butyracea]|uniref:Uncharacterized protein n=1 Tax=Rhodocollybia butyracea TaxID=206335 RepID=A0A9P5PJG0_9AGAR|nr:hypothetical protein BDP27DRAFT_1425842 [Rhodocollybia butyracea]
MSERGSGKKGNKPKRGWGLGLGIPSKSRGSSLFRGAHAASHSSSNSAMSDSRPNTRSMSRVVTNTSPSVPPAPPVRPGPLVPARIPVSGSANLSHSSSGLGVSNPGVESPASSNETVSPTKRSGPSIPNVVMGIPSPEEGTLASSSGMGSSPLTELSHTNSPPMADDKFEA